MRITNELDYARDIAVYGGFITVDAGATVDLAEHLPADVAEELGLRLLEQDTWTPGDEAAADKARAAAAAAEAEPVVDTPPEPETEPPALAPVDDAADAAWTEENS